MSDAASRIAALSPEQRELLLRRLRQQEGHSFAAPPEPLRIPAGPVNRHAPVPLTDVQETYWLGRSGLFDRGGSGTNVYVEYQFAGSVWSFAPALETALRRVIDRHEMLRVVLLPDGRQRVLPEVPPFEVGVEDLSGRRQEAVEKHLERVRDEMRYAKRPLDHWPLFEIVLHQLRDGMIRLHASLEAVLLDGATRDVLITEVVQFMVNPDVQLPALEISFLDYARALADYERTPTYQRSRAYWLERLPAMAPPARLPRSRPADPGAAPRIFKRTPLLLAPEPWAALKQRAARAGVTPTGLLTAAFAESLRPWVPSPAFTLGLVGSEHPKIHPQIRQVIGNFNTVHLLAIEDEPGPFEERAQAIQKRLAADLDHRHFSGHKVLREMNRQRRAGTGGTLEVLFDSIVELRHAGHRDEEEEATRRGSLDMTEIELLISMTQVLLLCVAIEEDDGSLTLVCQAVEEALHDGLVPRLLDSYRLLLEKLAGDEASWRAPRPEPGPASASERPAEEAGGPSRLPAAWDELETELAGLWEAVLGRRPAASGDDFFALGGDSLRAVRLLAHLQERRGAGLPPAELFARPDLEGMATAWRRAATSAKPSSLFDRLTSWMRRPAASPDSTRPGEAGPSPTRRTM